MADLENTQVNNTDNVENNAQNAGNENSNFDYSKLEEIINKGIKQKENAILKSYFTQQGLSENEMKEAIESFKNSKKSDAEELSTKYKDLETNYNNLQMSLKQEKLNNATVLSLNKKGLNEEQIPFILKMVDYDEEAFDEKGNVNKEKIDEKIDEILKAFPNLVSQKKENSGFIKIGADNSNETNNEESFFGFNFNKINK